ncbi:transcription repressor NadR, partial [Lacticaseibacillus rhamnosus]|nr:transcription repressor NadR [Lacticaseibacillus rhamnosus]
MLNSERQAHIKAALSTAAEPLSASSFARRFTVSRQ